MDIVIIGNGIAGVTLARHIRKNQIQKLLLYLLKLSFLFSYRFNVRVYGAHEV
jgi:NADH dehydrogenase FAD-containing subunit